MVANDDVWTYGRLATEVVRLSGGLRRASLLPGDRITLVIKTSPVYTVLLFAAMMTGSIAVSLKTELKAIELNEFVRRQRPAFFIHDADLEDVVLQMDPAVLACTQIKLSADDSTRSWRQLLEDTSLSDAEIPTDIDSPLLLLATSGTTGTPKLVAYSQRVISHVVGSLWSR